MDTYNLVSFTGIFILLGFAWLLSNDKKNMNYKVIIWGQTAAGLLLCRHSFDRQPTSLTR